MKRRYEFRHNTQIGEVEYRERLSFRFRFNPLDKRALNSIALDAQMEGIPLWDRDISRYIYSNRVPVFNPFLVRIRIGWICSTVGSSIWFLIGKEAIKSMRTVFRPYLSDRKGHVNLPFAGA